MAIKQTWAIGDLAEYMRKLYLEAGRGLWQPENKEYEQHNQAYIFQYMAVRLVEKVKPISSMNDYQRGYSAGYKAGKRKAKTAQNKTNDGGKEWTIYLKKPKTL